MKTTLIKSICVAVVGLLMVPCTASSQVIVDVSDSAGSTSDWLGFMNVFELLNNGDASTAKGNFIFGSGWGVPDLVANFDDGNNKLRLLPNSVSDPNEFWYQNTSGMASDPTNPGGPGQLGNKYMEANLFQAFGNGTAELAALQADGTLQFDGEIATNTLTDAHVGSIYIREFTPDFSTNVETRIAATPGVFSISHTLQGLGGEVQYGFTVEGENVWITDVDPFGNIAIHTVPEPGSALLLTLAAAGICSRRRRS